MHASAHLLTVILAAGLLQCRAQDGSSDESFLEVVTANDTKIEQLSQGQPLTGTLAYGERATIAFKVPKREADGLGFPDVLLTLDVTNEGGDADIFCIPLDVKNPPAEPPDDRANSVWSSEHVHGTEYVFISSNHSAYGAGVRVDFSKETGLKQTVAFLCAVWGFSRSSTDFELELDVDYAKRSLVEEEQTAVRTIFDKCCATSGCREWRALGAFVVGVDVQKDPPVMDLCHVVRNICDEDGHLLRLSMVNFGLECEFPLEEIAAFKRIERIELSRNRISGDIAEIADTLKVGYFPETAYSVIGQTLQTVCWWHFLDEKNSPICGNKL